ncbi:alpha/beta fold hydrolase [Deinococcus navajonensis]|uniref:Alpha/beta fold hydrolase n=1 Tax=Deinococcus navajonensis TaxID=309884 RepID=A0ABV8XNZ3_9DEIO
MSPPLPLVLLHGALESSRALAPLATALGTSAAVLPLDLQGHGGQPVPEVLRPRAMADAVLKELDRRGIERTCMFGYSLGGYVALLLAQTHPDRVAGVFAHATKIAWTPEVASREARGLNPERILEKAPAFAAALEQAHAPQDWRRLTERVAELLSALGEHPEVTDALLSALTVPVQLSVGDQDRLVSFEETVTAYRALARGRLLVMPGVPHPFGPGVQARLAPEIHAFLKATEAAN